MPDNIKEKNIILYVGGFELPDKNAAAHRVIANAKLLREIGYETVFIGISKSSISNKCPIYYKKHYGFKCFSTQHPNNSIQWFQKITSIKGGRAVLNEETKERLAAIICYNYPAVAMYKLKSLAAKLNIPLISDCTEWYQAEDKNLLVKLVKKADIYLRMSVIQKKIDGIIAISEYLKSYYSKCKVKTVLLPPLVDLSDSKWTLVIKEKKQDDNNIRFIYAGSPFSTRKNMKDRLDLVIQVLPELELIKKKFILDVVGISKEEYLNSFPEHAEIVDKYSKLVVFHGKLPHKDTLKMIANADYSVFFRDIQRVTMAGFPTKFVEAISCGTKVITNKTSDLVKYYENGDYGILINDIDKNSILGALKSAIINGSNMDHINSHLFRVFDYHNYINDFKYFIESIKN